MYITLILFLIGFLLRIKNILSQTSKFLSLESYKSVDLRGPTFKLLIEGFLNRNFSFSRFMVSGFKFFFFSSLHPRMEIEKEFNFYFFIKKIKIFGREVSVSGASCIISSHIVIKQSILSVGAFYVNIFVIRGIGVPNHRVPRWALNGLFK